MRFAIASAVVLTRLNGERGDPLVKRVGFARPIASVLFALALSACASQASHVGGDLYSADNACRQNVYRSQVELVQCFDSSERPVVETDLPSLLGAYEEWNSVRATAAIDFDRKVKSAQQNALTTFKAAVAEAGKKLNAAVAPIWPKDQKEMLTLK